MEKKSGLQKLLKRLATLQHNYTWTFMIIFGILSLVLFSGIGNIAFESDMMKEMPQSLPIFQLNNRVADSFGGQDTVLILFELEQDSNTKQDLVDLRDKEVMEYFYSIQKKISGKSSVESVMSAGLFFASSINNDMLTQETVDYVFDNVPEVSSFVSKDYTTAIMVINADVGSDEKKLDALEESINEAIKDTPSVPGLKATVTGTPSVMKTMIDMLKSDSLFTLGIAGLIIFIFLIFMERSFTKAFLVFAPLIFGVLWTIGLMGWINLKISIATAGLGAMLLGLGVEYGVFTLTRYKEERAKGHNQLKSMEVSLPSVGSAMIGSSMTTIAGFLALTLSITPMMQHLGLSLAIGIGFCLIAAIGLAPVIILLEERYEHYITEKRFKKYGRRHAKHKEVGK